MTTQKEFVIKRFEANYPELMKIIEEWTNISIEYDLDDIKIMLNSTNLTNIPPDEWDNKGQVNKRHEFYTYYQNKIIEYLQAKGFKAVGYSMGTTTLHKPKTETKSELSVNGYMITAYIKTPENLI